MTIEYLKKAIKTSATNEDQTREIVKGMLKEIEGDGEVAVKKYSKNLDGWEGNVVITPEDIEVASTKVPSQLKDDLSFSGLYSFLTQSKKSLFLFSLI